MPNAMTDAFFNAYLECAIWTTTDGDGDPATISVSDFAPETMDQLRAECADFYAANAETWQTVGMSDDYAGHDFCLTRNHHGAGFWDRGIGEAGRILTDACRSYGESNLYVGDNGEVFAT